LNAEKNKYNNLIFFKSKIRKTEKISKKTWKYVICLLKKNKIRDLH